MVSPSGAAASPLLGEGGDDISLAGPGAEAGVSAPPSLGEGVDELEDDGEVAASREEAGEGEGGDVADSSCAKTPAMATKVRARTMT